MIETKEDIDLSKYTEGLNSGQLDAFNKLISFSKSEKNEMFILRGYAGTGKTFLVKKFVQYILDNDKKSSIAVTAPTNKAVKVLYRSSTLENKNVSYQTVHKLLGLKEKITKDGKQVFEKGKNQVTELSFYKYLIVDEVSMLNDELFLELKDHKDRVKIIFMGDPAQIPPVNKTDCIPFGEEKHKYDFIEHSLNEIMRQANDNPIIEYSFLIRENLEKSNPIKNIESKIVGNFGVIRVDSSDADERKNILKTFNDYFNCEEFKNDSDYAKIIAWRNITINKTNDIIRKLIFGNLDSLIMMGEKLIANKPIFVPDTTNIIFNTSDEFEVVGIKIVHVSIKVVKSQESFKCYQCRVKYLDMTNEECYSNVTILHEDSIKKFETILSQLKDFAIKNNGEKGSWVRYFEFERCFADVGYNYAITAHKSQGSTYKNVFVIEDDIDINANLIERNRIKYTAYSRPSQKLFIIKR
jgi:exodeoxyribonuclease V